MSDGMLMSTLKKMGKYTSDHGGTGYRASRDVKGSEESIKSARQTRIDDEIRERRRKRKAD